MSQLTHARAMLEAEMDFSDEGDVPGSVADSIWDGLLELHDRMSSHLKNFEWGEIVRDGFRVAFTGAPNVGKSSLINKLADRDVAIVSSIPGTTRDSLEVRLSIGGYLVLLSDTAGLRSSSDEIEMEGMRRAHRAIQSADLVLHLIDGSITADEPDFSPGERGKVVRVGTKSDLNPDYGEAVPELRLSALTGEGLDDLVSRIKLEIAHMNAGGVKALPNRERYRVQINECLQELSLARNVRDEGPEIIAEHLRRAARSLGKITGHVGVEDLLGMIFSEFCVGK